MPCCYIGGGQHAEAFDISARALHACNELPAADRDARRMHLTLLTTLVKSDGRPRCRAGHGRAGSGGLDISAQVLLVSTELAAADREAYLTDLTLPLAVNGLALVRSGRVADAVGVLVERMKSTAELPEDSGIPLNEFMSSFLRDAYKADPWQAEAAFRDATGSEFLEMLR